MNHRTSTAMAYAPTQPQILGGWRLIRRLQTTRWFQLDLAAPATCEPDWPADYVVKSVRPGVVPAWQPTAWLRREFEVAQQVAHPHLATVLCGEFDEEPAFIVQPWYDGRSVAEMLAEGKRFGVSTVLWIARQVGEALQALHRAGWIHGDVKPANWMFSPVGHVTLLDLGFAQRISARTQSIPAGVLQTSLAYAAPELFLETAEPTCRADVYSLGIGLYEMLAGRRPFQADHPSDLAREHVHTIPTDVRALNPQVPSHVARLVMRMLLKEPARRPSADELVEALTRCEIDCFELV